MFCDHIQIRVPVTVKYGSFAFELWLTYCSTCGMVNQSATTIKDGKHET